MQKFKIGPTISIFSIERFTKKESQLPTPILKKKKRKENISLHLFFVVVCIFCLPVWLIFYLAQIFKSCQIIKKKVINTERKV